MTPPDHSTLRFWALILLLSTLALSACESDNDDDTIPANDDDLTEDDTSEEDDTTDEPYVEIPFAPSSFPEIWIWADEAVPGLQLEINVGVLVEHDGGILALSFPLLLTRNSFDADGKVKPEAVILREICADFDTELSLMDLGLTRIIQEWRSTYLPYAITAFELVAFGNNEDRIEGWLGPSTWSQVSFRGEPEERMPSNIVLPRFEFIFTKTNYVGHWGECNSTDED